ncbi:MAG TPA: tRNA (guanosine(46)-N7)-methyltransferase TrmB [Mycobacteriales bacterium]|jgi:tRNA (guanine-N7-)-methyltransferase|nr:tRNA (guanosine(46)-N7)-methyltransferase TrmB [Mycobacteriales bacterium]
MSVPGAPLRTFKHRRGRITAGQQRALDTLWARYGIDVGTRPLDVEVIYQRAAPLVLEVGFGMGEATIAMAAAAPGTDLLAVDVHTPGAGALLREVNSLGLSNVRVVVGDVRDVLADMLAPESLEEVRIYFPDPWPKAKHRKRRLLSPAFLHLTATRLRPGGRLHCATDSKSYAEQMLMAIAGEALLGNQHPGYAPRPAGRPVTRFEGQALARGHDLFELSAVKVSAGRQLGATG